MFQIPVYKAERDDGLEALVRSSAKVLCAVKVGKALPQDVSQLSLSTLRNFLPERAKGSTTDFDLEYHDTILTTVGWNKNDDVFDGVEVWQARATPKDKQLNYEHDDTQIVGHIVNSFPINDDGSIIADDTVVDALPAKYHIKSGVVTYKCWQKDEQQKRADDLSAEIAKGQWFVSMECLFKGFDYALKAADGTCKIVARNERTAFLTKHLRAYGGSGQYGGNRLGRVMRNIVFSGVGFVRQPANPESIIFPQETESFTATAGLLTDFERNSSGQVYSVSTTESERVQESKNKMTIELQLADAQAKNVALATEVATLKAGQTESAIADYKNKLEIATAAKVEADKLLKQAGDALTAAVAEKQVCATEIIALKASLETAKKDLEDAKAELATLHNEQITASRIETVKTKLKMNAEDAAKYVASLATLSGDLFTAQVDVIAKAWVTNNPASGGTPSAPGTASPKAAPKATNAGTPPNATSLPTPAKAAEDDANGEGAAAAANLESATATAEPSLSTRISDAGVSDVQKAIAAHFGYAEPAAE